MGVLYSSVSLEMLITCASLCSRSGGGALFGKGHISVDLNPDGIFSGLMVTPTPSLVGSQLAICISRLL